MEILIIEDDLNKYQHIIEFIDKNIENTNFTLKQSYQSGLRECLTKKYDLIILDMSLPTYDINPPQELGGPFRTFAGKEILSELKRRKINQKILIVTQFESFGEGKSFITLNELKQKIDQEFPYLYLDAVYYNAFETSWQEKVLLIINCILGNIND